MFSLLLFLVLARDCQTGWLLKRVLSCVPNRFVNSFSFFYDCFSFSDPLQFAVTQLDAIGLFSLPHDLAKRDEIRRVRDNELSLALPMKFVFNQKKKKKKGKMVLTFLFSREFQPFFDKSEANQAKTSGKKGGEEKTEEPPSLPSTDSPASPTLIRSPSPSSSSSSTSKSNSGSSSTNLTGSFQGFVYYPKLQAPPPSKEEIIQPTPSLASQPLYTSQISLPPSVSSSFFSAFSTLHPSHPEKSLEDGWVDIRGSADVYFEKEWKVRPKRADRGFCFFRN